MTYTITLTQELPQIGIETPIKQTLTLPLAPFVKGDPGKDGLPYQPRVGDVMQSYAAMPPEWKLLDGTQPDPVSHPQLVALLESLPKEYAFSPIPGRSYQGPYAESATQMLYSAGSPILFTPATGEMLQLNYWEQGEAAVYLDGLFYIFSKGADGVARMSAFAADGTPARVAEVVGEAPNNPGALSAVIYQNTLVVKNGSSAWQLAGDTWAPFALPDGAIPSFPLQAAGDVLTHAADGALCVLMSGAQWTQLSANPYMIVLDITDGYVYHITPTDHLGRSTLADLLAGAPANELLPGYRYPDSKRIEGGVLLFVQDENSGETVFTTLKNGELSRLRRVSPEKYEFAGFALGCPVVRTPGGRSQGLLVDTTPQLPDESKATTPKYIYGGISA